MESYFLSVIFFVYLSTLSLAHLFAIRGEGFKDGRGYKGGLQKSKFANSLVNWGKFRSSAWFSKNSIIHLYYESGKTEKSS